MQSEGAATPQPAAVQPAGVTEVTGDDELGERERSATAPGDIEPVADVITSVEPGATGGDEQPDTRQPVTPSGYRLRVRHFFHQAPLTRT